MKVVISGSAKLEEKVEYWNNYFLTKNYEVLDFPKKIAKEKFLELYPEIHKQFLENVTKADMLFVMNEDKDGKEGYIGAETFAELLFGLSQRLVYERDIELVILKLPSKDVFCYDEISTWLKLGWLKIFEE